MSIQAACQVLYLRARQSFNGFKGFINTLIRLIYMVSPCSFFSSKMMFYTNASIMRFILVRLTHLCSLFTIYFHTSLYYNMALQMHSMCYMVLYSEYSTFSL